MMLRMVQLLQSQVVKTYNILAELSPDVAESAAGGSSTAAAKVSSSNNRTTRSAKSKHVVAAPASVGKS